MSDGPSHPKVIAQVGRDGAHISVPPVSYRLTITDPVFRELWLVTTVFIAAGLAGVILARWSSASFSFLAIPAGIISLITALLLGTLLRALWLVRQAVDFSVGERFLQVVVDGYWYRKRHVWDRTEIADVAVTPTPIPGFSKFELQFCMADGQTFACLQGRPTDELTHVRDWLRSVLNLPESPAPLCQACVPLKFGDTLPYSDLPVGLGITRELTPQGFVIHLRGGRPAAHMQQNIELAFQASGLILFAGFAIMAVLMMWYTSRSTPGWQRAAGPLFLLAIGLWSLRGYLRARRKRPAAPETLPDDELSVEAGSLALTDHINHPGRRYTWPAGQILLIRVAGDDNTLLGLEITTRDGQPHVFYRYREFREIEWLARTLTGALGIAADERR